MLALILMPDIAVNLLPDGAVMICLTGGRVKWSCGKYVGRNLLPEETEQVLPF
jgi:hypothetical protein